MSTSDSKEPEFEEGADPDLGRYLNTKVPREVGALPFTEQVREIYRVTGAAAAHMFRNAKPIPEAPSMLPLGVSAELRPFDAFNFLEVVGAMTMQTMGILAGAYHDAREAFIGSQHPLSFPSRCRIMHALCTMPGFPDLSSVPFSQEQLHGAMIENLGVMSDIEHITRAEDNSRQVTASYRAAGKPIPDADTMAAIMGEAVKNYQKRERLSTTPPSVGGARPPRYVRRETGRRRRQ